MPSSLGQQPLELAALCLSLLQTQSFETLLSLSSPYIKDRHAMTIKPLAKSRAHLFSWQDDDFKFFLDRFILSETPRLIRFRIWDSEMIQAAIPFGEAPGEMVAIILLYLGPDHWVYHDIKVLAEGWEQFSRNWHPSMEEAMAGYKEQLEMNVKNKGMGEEDDEASYWNSYNEIADTTMSPVIKSLDIGDSTTITSDDEYWNAY